MTFDRGLQNFQDTIRIPVYREERAREDSNNEVQEYINCFPNVIKNTLTGDQEVEITKRPGLWGSWTGTFNVFSTTGASVQNTLFCKANMTVTQLNDVCVAAFFDSANSKTYIIQYRPDAGTSAKIGEISSTAKTDFIHITEAQIVNSGTIYAGITVVWTKNDRSASKGYHARSDNTKFSATTLTQITDTDFPDQQTPAKVITGPIQQMNGLFSVMTTDGLIYTSGGADGTQNDPTTWNAETFIRTYAYPDNGVGIYRYKHHMVAFGQDSIEFFNDVGNPPPRTPFQRTEQAFIKFGAFTSVAIINVDDILYWLSYGTSNTAGLWKLDGYTPVKISNSKEDYLIHVSVEASGNNVAYMNLFSIFISQKKHIGINSVVSHTRTEYMTTGWGAANDTYKVYQTYDKGKGGVMLYNASDNVWWNWSSMQGYYHCLFPTGSFPGTANADEYYEQYIFSSPLTQSSSTNSPTRVYKFGAQVNGFYIDDDPDGSVGSLPIAITINLNSNDFATLKRKRVNRLSLAFASVPRWSVTDASLNTVYSINLIYTKFNGVTTNSYDMLASDVIQRSIVYPNNQYRYYFNNLGMGRYWNFTITALSKDAFQLKFLELDIQQGTH